ncbi:MAG: hypothetical protein COT71_00930 [Candidatus Andersenbacteria bacterium CG10_big_fil_rev_8_21_14_0_10_54_11]|uniref:Uncharacterized protein n=1 Tax=Candidatus Andersenbacteria bacterium CG10_big_fil_rev_8_21_14_0_10_54_11 TaxID=1974485 RepID=A0A2M6X068_9BACT|nr:MAG: hypothetical protein COT71_00930 [Candidatus Andersenbacteria bacterium CG10_big_fil_rev_8_21_14_0_10_54_11]
MNLTRVDLLRLGLALLAAGLLLAVALDIFWLRPLPASPTGGSESEDAAADTGTAELGSDASASTAGPDEFRLPAATEPRGLNLVFMSDAYPSWEEFEADIAAVMLELKKIEPWQSYNHFNIYKINPQQGDLCAIKTADERKPTLRCGEGVNAYLNQLPLERFKLIILSRQNFQSWANVARLENSAILFSLTESPTDATAARTQGLLLAHLFGHAFGLKDEELHVIAKAGGAPHTPDGPNCAPDQTTAEAWWGDLAAQDSQVGYFPGCAGNVNYLKPTEASIMNLNTGADLVFTYGPVSERYLKTVLNLCFAPQVNSSESLDSDQAKFLERYPEFSACLE